MEKRVWTMPRVEVEQFEMSQYIAACGDSGKVYKFVCDAGDGVSGDVYLETNDVAGLQTDGQNRDKYLSGYHACGTSHEAESNSEFLDGYYVVDGGLFGEDTVTPVIVWRGPKNNNTHCTVNLNIDSWETAKS